MRLPSLKLLKRKAFRLVVRRTQIPVLLAMSVLLASGLYADRQNRQVFEQDIRTGAIGDLSALSSRLEGNVNSNIQLVRGLIAILAYDPYMSQQRLATIVKDIVGDRTSQIRNIAVAPDFVVSMVYPLAGNEKALGLDYRKNEAQRQTAFRARDTGKLVFAGPVNLVQGGRAFIGRFPVFTTGTGGQKQFFGIVSVVIDEQQLFEDSGLYDPNIGLDIAITGRDATGNKGELFYGRPEILEQDPVTLTVNVPNGSWRISAIPRGGWPTTPPNSYTLWFFILLAGSLIIVPTIFLGRLIEERTRNVRELKLNGGQLRRLSRRLELAVDSSQIGVWELNTDDESLIWDDRMNELYGMPRDGGPRSYDDWQRVIHPDDLPRILDESPTPTVPGRTLQLEYRLLLPDGTIRHVRESAKSYQDEGEPLRLVGVNWDVTADVVMRERLSRANMMTEARNAELEAAKGRIEYNALHDSLTGLPNRRYLDEVLAQHAVEFYDAGERAALLHIDLDRFKQINDTLGHAAGDAMLIHAAKVLKARVGENDFVARVGGDEFVVIRRTTSEMGAKAWHESLAYLAKRIITQMHHPVMFEGHECRFGVSIGIATNMEAENPADLLVHADIALYRAKSRGRNRHQFFNEALQTEIITTKRVADEILWGIERNEFIAYYQPQFDASTHEVIGVEALARWKHPAKGLLAPASFMSIAEELNVMSSIDRIVLKQTLSDLAIWDRNGLSIPKASVNVSAKRLRDEDLIASLKKLHIEPGRLSFELVESIFLDDTEELTSWNVDHIKELGIDIEIDDFGTGHASIVGLMKLQPKRLKIDRQLVQPIVNSVAQRKLVQSIIEIGRSLGIEILAEGVESLEQARVLEELGCNALQGYAFSRPMSSDDLVRFLGARQLRAAS